MQLFFIKNLKINLWKLNYNYGPGAKVYFWCYLVTALLYLLAGGPRGFEGEFLIATTCIALSLFGLASQTEKQWVCKVMILFMIINLASLCFAKNPVTVGAYFGNKFLYIFGLSFFVPEWLNGKINSVRRQTWAIKVGTLLLLIPYYIFNEQRLQPSASDAWYTGRMGLEDVSFGLMVVLLMAAFNMPNNDMKRVYRRRKSRIIKTISKG